jgi:hypothetical protein
VTGSGDAAPLECLAQGWNPLARIPAAQHP